MVELPEPGRHRGLSWAARAACLDRPDLPWHKGRYHLDAMRAVCATCPVRAECLAEALADPEAVGVWAGTTVEERAALRR
jgi:WhiB family redox-sensing transcriptional regulator